ncbi:hypothetical protein [Nonomuraea aurantiaca]|uniref:hypothetical protein n=1 Tax=Nonomuraea aurantiaca TaxID=2878562 RepID=UPI001CD99AD5|nr:hypothetical protein [Nonomuraea aurantiaca]MCA2229684.1 hypothetical protein [Nonomuraea aurantiaca]
MASCSPSPLPGAWPARHASDPPGLVGGGQLWALSTEQVRSRRCAWPSGPTPVDGIRAVLESRAAELEKSAQRGRLAQQH